MRVVILTGYICCARAIGKENALLLATLVRMPEEHAGDGDSRIASATARYGSQRARRWSCTTDIHLSLQYFLRARRVLVLYRYGSQRARRWGYRAEGFAFNGRTASDAQFQRQVLDVLERY